MAGKTEHKPLKDLSFNVEATHDEKAIVNNASDVPIRVRVKVHNKNDPKVSNNYWLSLSDSKGKILKHSASDQTILSFKLLMQSELDKNTSRRPRKSFINRLLPGVCLGIPNSDDENPYLPGQPSKDNNSIIINPGRTQAGVKQRQKNKYKPGGCLDPPFGEESYAYAPTNIRPTSEESCENSILNKGDILIQKDTKSSDQVSSKSSGLITYPASSPKSDIEKNTTTTMSEQKRRSSQYSDSAEMYFKPAKAKDTEESPTDATKGVIPILGAVGAGTAAGMTAGLTTILKHNETKDEWNTIPNKSLRPQYVDDSVIKKPLDEHFVILEPEMKTKTESKTAFDKDFVQESDKPSNIYSTQEPLTYTDRTSIEDLSQLDGYKKSDKIRPPLEKLEPINYFDQDDANAEFVESDTPDDLTTGKYLMSDTEIINEDKNRGYTNPVLGIVGVGAIGGILVGSQLQKQKQDPQNENNNINKETEEGTILVDEVNKKETENKITSDDKSGLRSGDNIDENENENINKEIEEGTILVDEVNQNKKENKIASDDTSDLRLIDYIDENSNKKPVQNANQFKEHDSDNIVDKLKEGGISEIKSHLDSLGSNEKESTGKKLTELEDDVDKFKNDMERQDRDKNIQSPQESTSSKEQVVKEKYLHEEGDDNFVHKSKEEVARVDDFTASTLEIVPNDLTQGLITKHANDKNFDNSNLENTLPMTDEAFSKIVTGPDTSDTKMKKDKPLMVEKGRVDGRSGSISLKSTDKELYKDASTDRDIIDNILWKQKQPYPETERAALDYTSINKNTSSSIASSKITSSQSSFNQQRHQPNHIYKYRYDTPQKTNKGKDGHMKMNIAFQTYVDKNKDLIIKTLDPRSIDANRSDNITKKKITSFSEGVEIPINSKNTLLLRMQSTADEFPDKTQGNKTAHFEPKLKKDERSSSTNDFLSEGKRTPNAKRDLTAINKCLGLIYEQQLVPLQKTINNLREELQALTQAQIKLSQKMRTKEKPTLVRISPKNRKCSCYHNHS